MTKKEGHWDAEWQNLFRLADLRTLQNLNQWISWNAVFFHRAS
jgi:hypothetical protein